MLNDAEKRLIQNSWRLLAPLEDTAADVFYRRLFELKPAYQQLFKSDLPGHKRKLIAMLGFIVAALDWPDAAWRDAVADEDDLFLTALALGRRHGELYSVPDAAYAAFGEALLWMLDHGLGKEFTAPVRAVWAKVYGLVSTAMKMGRLSAASGPASDAIARRAAPGSTEAEPS
ncbi:MAG TPA: globin domain-containing protein [Kofleriaceae bacterium]|nr:globin domain-containing protein [Kofleriaceae bacterium]